MNYYEAHEIQYQRVLAQEKSSWDEGIGQAPDFESFCNRPFLRNAFQKSIFSSKSPKGLELGCGTGPACCFLAEKGFQMEGYDISSTAIKIAKKQAEQRQLSVQYQTTDICKINLPEASYDLILDGHCLHCIVFEEERNQLYKNIHQALKPEGYFWIATMIGGLEMKWAKHSLYDEEGILWSKWNKNPLEYKEAKQIQGQWYIPQRRIYPNVIGILKELEENHFQVIWNEPIEEKSGEPSEYQAICKKR